MNDYINVVYWMSCPETGGEKVWSHAVANTQHPSSKVMLRCVVLCKPFICHLQPSRIKKTKSQGTIMSCHSHVTSVAG